MKRENVLWLVLYVASFTHSKHLDQTVRSAKSFVAVVEPIFGAVVTQGEKSP